MGKDGCLNQELLAEDTCSTYSIENGINQSSTYSIGNGINQWTTTNKASMRTTAKVVVLVIVNHRWFHPNLYAVLQQNARKEWAGWSVVWKETELSRVLDWAALLHMCEDYSFPAEAKIDGSQREESHRCMAGKSKQGEDSSGNPD